MDRSETIKLISQTYAQDTIGQYVPTQAEKTVYAQVTSVSGSEWFEAGRNGINASLRFVVYGPDYNDQRIVEYRGQKYSVYRTYIGKGETVDLYCESKAGTV